MPEIDWEDVLLAWLHDPFDKALAIQGHATRAARYASAALGREVSRMGLPAWRQGADMVAAITERLVTGMSDGMASPSGRREGGVSDTRRGSRSPCMYAGLAQRPCLAGMARAA